ncbi:MAG: hypothetical protein SGVNAXEH_000519 [Holophagaceae bacterium]
MDLQAITLLSVAKWVHLVLFGTALGGGAACLIISGLEESDSAYKGLSAALWKSLVNWSLRLTFIVGMLLLILNMQMGQSPFLNKYFHYKLLFVFVLLGLSESASKSLATGKRTLALSCVIVIALIGFIIENQQIFGQTIPREITAVQSEQ